MSRSPIVRRDRASESDMVAPVIPSFPRQPCGIVAPTARPALSRQTRTGPRPEPRAECFLTAIAGTDPSTPANPRPQERGCKRCLYHPWQRSATLGPFSQFGELSLLPSTKCRSWKASRFSAHGWVAVMDLGIVRYDVL